MKKGTIFGVLMWIVGILIVLAVIFGLISKTLVIPFLPAIITVIAGWIALIALIVGAIVKVADY